MSAQRFDVVVIGSGIGGMGAAALLSKRGYKTLVVERLPFVGGRSSTREMKGFKLTTGVIAVEMGGVIEALFKEVGAEFDVRPDSGLRYRIGGQDFEMPAKGGLKAVLNFACGDEKETDRIYEIVRRGWKWQEPPGTLTFKEWLSQYTQNTRLVNFFQGMLSAMLGGNIWELPANAFTRFLTLMGGYRAFGVAPRGNLHLMESLAQVVKKSGGDVWTRCPARHILVEKDVAKGVIVEKDGQKVTVSSQAVISDAAPKATIQLIGAEKVDRAYIKLVNDTQLPAAEIWFQIASDKPLIPYGGLLVPTDTRRINLITCPTNVAPELAPKGKSLLIAGAPPRAMAPPYDYRGDLDLALLDLKENLPGFDKAEVLMAAHFHSNWPVMWTLPGREIPNKMNVENLWLVGDGVVPPGWVALPGSAFTGRLAVEDLVKRLRPSA